MIITKKTRAPLRMKEDTVPFSNITDNTREHTEEDHNFQLSYRVVEKNRGKPRIFYLFIQHEKTVMAKCDWETKFVY